ncbi:protein of unknown function [Cyanobium sp. NIES-981]|nr:protein of unknown function [Cyanobium sp. NIES-981]
MDVDGGQRISEFACGVPNQKTTAQR